MECIKHVVLVKDFKIFEALEIYGNKINATQLNGYYWEFPGSKNYGRQFVCYHVDLFDMYDDEIYELIEYSKQIVLAYWKYSDGSRKWTACENGVDDFIDDEKIISERLYEAYPENNYLPNKPATKKFKPKRKRHNSK